MEAGPPAPDPPSHADGYVGDLAVRAEWDSRYANRERLWSGQPNGALVAEVAGLAPGRVLDVGCGEGADAIWLACGGWDVTALEVSGVALGRAAGHARDAGVAVHWVHAGLADAALPPASFDLVSAQYPALRAPPNAAAERALLAAVAPGGVLLLVHHAGMDTQLASGRRAVAQPVRGLEHLAAPESHPRRPPPLSADRRAGPRQQPAAPGRLHDGRLRRRLHRSRPTRRAGSGRLGRQRLGGHVGTVFAANNAGRCRSLVSIAAPVHALLPDQRRGISAALVAYRLLGPVKPLVKVVVDGLLGNDSDPAAAALVADAFRRASAEEWPPPSDRHR